MSNKRKNASSIFHNHSQSKRRRNSEPGDSDDDESSTRAVQPKVDPTYGQRGAFPGLDGGEDEQLFYGPASDGLEYLRMVRSEARSVPTLLVAPTSHETAHHKIDSKSSNYEEGYYADGAYTAAPAPPTYRSTSSSTSDSDLDPQEAYHASLCSRFASHNAILRDPPLDLVPSSSSTNIARTLNSGSSNYRWRSILSTKPSMLLLGQLSQEAVLQGLSALEGRLSEKNLRKEASLGLWAWGLLGRCRDVGEMGSEEVGVLRDLGKRAIWVLRGVQAGLAETNEADVYIDGSGDEGKGGETRLEEGIWPRANPSSVYDATAGAQAQGETKNEVTVSHQSESADSLEAAKARMLASLPPEFSKLKPVTTENSAGMQSPSSPDLPGAQPESSANITAPALNDVDDQEMKLQATLDMIITIVGEFYGQRDLLSGRLSWDES